jgi:Coenzyme PQQ synthesis protein D (PqqD)
MRYAVNSGQVISEIVDGEAVMINLTTGNYYSLNESGSAIWAAIEAGAGAGEIVEQLAGRYEGDRSEIEGGANQLISELLAEELIVTTDGDGSATQPLQPGSTRTPFPPPVLEKHTDMQDLILLDPVHEVGDQGWPHVKANGDAAPSADRVPE